MDGNVCHSGLHCVPVHQSVFGIPPEAKFNWFKVSKYYINWFQCLNIQANYGSPHFSIFSDIPNLPKTLICLTWCQFHSTLFGMMGN